MIDQTISRISRYTGNESTTNVSNFVSYSYGGKQTLKEFNEKVSRHGAPSITEISANDNYKNNYRGDILDATEGETDPEIIKHGSVGAGDKQWPGLFEDEYHVWEDNGRTGDHIYDPKYWAGIDCIGLVIHGLRYAWKPSDYGSVQHMAKDRTVPGVNIADACIQLNDDNVTCKTGAPVDSDDRAIMPLLNTSANKFFRGKDEELMHYWPKSKENQKLIHQGDVVRYGIYAKHISMVYSDEASCSEKGDCSYEIIHASGYNYIDANGNNIDDPEEFSRKVLSTKSKNMPVETTGFGRIKLWD